MSYFRANIDAMAGYTPGEQPQVGEVIKLNTNENPYPPAPGVFDAIAKAATDRLRRYPDPLANVFRKTAAHVLGVEPEMIVACNGSDDSLTILARATAGPDDLIVSPTPSYPLYRTLAQIQGCRYEERPFLPGGRLPPNLCDGARLVLVPNPNSPTGTRVPAREMAAAAQGASGLFVADEAYGDFAEENCIPLVRSCERLVVTRSLSKSYSLAGIRFGFIVAQPQIARTLIKVKDSYNVDALSIAAAAAALADQDYFRENVRKILATRSRMETSLAKLGFDVTPSEANFVWIRRAAPVEPIYQGLKERGILIRWLKYPGYGEGLRISVGTDSEIDRLLEVMRPLV
jgi:histidinol-phosphate aminotransferase